LIALSVDYTCFLKLTLGKIFSSNFSSVFVFSV